MAKPIQERRSFHVELRAEGDEDDPKIVGYAAVFDSATNLGPFTEVIRKGAFKKTIGEADVRALWNHNDDHVLGRSKSGTLILEEDEKGLKIEIDPPDTQAARDLMHLMDRGDVDQMSFAFRAVKEKWTEAESDDEDPVRELLEVRLYDVSPVTYPAYEDTIVALRKHLEDADLADDERKALRSILGDAGDTEPTGSEPEAREEEPPLAGHSVTNAMLLRQQLAERTKR